MLVIELKCTSRLWSECGRRALAGAARAAAAHQAALFAQLLHEAEEQGKKVGCVWTVNDRA